MIISRISIRRPIFATVISLLLVVLGAGAILLMPVREFPDIDPPVVSVATVYPGASAAVVDREVTESIEEQISSIEGINTITSTSRDGLSSINIEFSLDRDIDAAAADVRDQVSRARDDLPDEAEDPIISKVSGDAQPVIWIRLTSDIRTPLQLTDYADRNLVDPLSVIPGVARVIIGGERLPSMRVWLNLEAMESLGIAVNDVTRALRLQNIELAAGRVESPQREFSIRAKTRLETVEDFRDMVVLQRGGTQITLDRIARVDIGPESERTAVFANGEDAVGLGVVRQSKANTVAVSQGITVELDRLRQALPADMELEIAYNEADFIEGSIVEVLKTMAITGTVVIVVIFLFLRSIRTTLVPAVTIPVSLISTMIVLWALGYSINTLTLLALVLAIGLVVDDSIVVLENVYRRHEEGETRLVAAARGSDQVGFAVIATTLVLVAVFVPLAFIPGDVGRLFTEFGIALAAAVSFSSLVALTLGAMLSSKAIREERQQHGRLYEASERALNWTSARYGDGLGRVVGHPFLILLLALALGAIGYFLWRGLTTTLAPTEDRGVLILPVQSPEGASFAYTAEVVREIEQIVQQTGGGEDGPIEDVLSIVGPAQQGPAQVDQAFMILKLRDWEDRDIPQQALANQLQPRLIGLPGARAFAVNPPSLGQGGFQEPVQIAIGGPSYELAAQWGEEVLARIREETELLDPRIDYNEKRPQIELTLDRRAAADLGIAPAAVAEALRVLFGGDDVTTWIDRSREYEVMVEARDEDKAQPDAILNLRLRAGSGELVALRSVVQLRELGAAQDLRRVNRSPSVRLTGSLAEGASFGDTIDAINEIMQDSLPPGARVTYLGQAENYVESSRGIYLIMGIGLLVVFLVLAALFENFLHPLVIMAAVPVAFTGGLATLALFGISFNIFSQIGLILLIGLVAKNGILLIDFANQLRDAGKNVRESALEAGRIRLRPVLMTSVGTIFGALPLALATGPGSEGRTAIGWAVIGGMILSTVITLFIVPTLYAALGRFTRPVGEIARKLEKQEKEDEQADDGRQPQPGE